MSHICTLSLSSAFLIPRPILCITLTKLFPGSIRTRLKILGILMPTAATPYVAIIILFWLVDTSSYCSFLSVFYVDPDTNTASLIFFSRISPADILSTSISVFPDVAMSCIVFATHVILVGSVVNHFNSSP